MFERSGTIGEISMNVMYKSFTDVNHTCVQNQAQRRNKSIATDCQRSNCKNSYVTKISSLLAHTHATSLVRTITTATIVIIDQNNIIVISQITATKIHYANV